MLPSRPTRVSQRHWLRSTREAAHPRSGWTLPSAACYSSSRCPPSSSWRQTLLSRGRRRRRTRWSCRACAPAASATVPRSWSTSTGWARSWLLAQTLTSARRPPSSTRSVPVRSCSSPRALTRSRRLARTAPSSTTSLSPASAQRSLPIPCICVTLEHSSTMARLTSHVLCTTAHQQHTRSAASRGSSRATLQWRAPCSRTAPLHTSWTCLRACHSGRTASTSATEPATGLAASWESTRGPRSSATGRRSRVATSSTRWRSA
mmetsp:Transcript_2241/g.7987  ORF Transcript_2241/g.7987 Transcript_2241/m.7987 type:complete len:262 (-) Transcript_2241:338-1123(-)